MGAGASGAQGYLWGEGWGGSLNRVSSSLPTDSFRPAAKKRKEEELLEGKRAQRQLFDRKSSGENKSITSYRQ